MVVFGGLGHIWGGSTGAIIITIVYDLTRPLCEYQYLCWLNNCFNNFIRKRYLVIDKIFIDKRFKKRKLRKASNVA